MKWNMLHKSVVNRTFVMLVNVSVCFLFTVHIPDTLRRVDATPSLRTDVDKPSTLTGAMCFMVQQARAASVNSYR